MGVLLVLSGVITFQLELLNLKERESFIEALGTSATSIVCGMALVVQSSFNQRIGLILGDMRGAPVISTFIGSVLSLVANITLLPAYKIQSEKFSWDNLWLWTGGMIGSFGLCCVTYAPSKIGMIVTFTCMVLGQLTGSLIFDSLGLFGMEKRPATVNRVLGVVLTVMGVILTNMWNEETSKLVEVSFKTNHHKIKNICYLNERKDGDNLACSIDVCV